MPAAKPSASSGILVPIAAESESPRSAGRIRLAKAMAAKRAARIPGMATLRAKPNKRPSNRVKLSDSDLAQITALKQRLLTLDANVKKSQLLSAGLALLAAMNDVELSRIVAQTGAVKPRNPAPQAS
jgi:hypothetical protein